MIMKYKERQSQPLEQINKGRDWKVTKVESKGGVREGPGGTRKAMTKTL